MTIPNILTLLRIALVPLMVVMLLCGSFMAALVLFAVAGVTDALDGFIARHFNQMSRLGSFLDPLADKVLIVAMYGVLAGIGMLPVWLAVLVIGRDLVILSGALFWFLRIGELEMEPTLSSKINMIVQVVFVCIVIATAAGFPLPVNLQPLLILVAGGIALFSGGQYIAIWLKRYRSVKTGEAS